MSRYESLVGKRVEAQYRAAEIQLNAIGTLICDSGESVTLEDRFSVGGKDKTMRVEIPYEYVISVEEIKGSATAPVSGPAFPAKKRP